MERGINMVTNNNEFVSPLINSVGPDFNIPGQHDKEQDMGGHGSIQQWTQPTLFGEDQFKNNFGPVYAVPGQYDGNLNIGGGHQSIQQETHPALFGADQFKNNFGPVYAIPSMPGQPSPNQSTGKNSLPTNHVQGQGMKYGQCHQCCHCHNAMTLYCMYPLFGNQNGG